MNSFSNAAKSDTKAPRERIERFNFSRDFSPRPEDELPVEPMISLKEHEAICQARIESASQKSYESGRECELVQEKRAETQQLARLADQLAVIAQTLEVFEARAQHQAVGLAHAIAAKLAGHALQQFEMESVMAFLHEAITQLAEPEVVTLEVPPNLLAPVQDWLGNADVPYHARLTVKANDDLDVGDCIVHGAQGSVSRIVSDLTDQIDRLVETFVATLPSASADLAGQEKSDG